MQIIVDSAIPYIKGILEPYGEIIYKKGVDICAEDIRNCDAMIIRTRTICNERLLSGSRVKFIGSATIGFDHIDMRYCGRNGISVSTAAGCNKHGVVQYVIASLIALKQTPKGKTLGVIGVGNVGSAVAAEAASLGYSVLVNDPPRAERESNFVSTALEELLAKSDIITIHTPLNKEGEFKTEKFADSSFFEKMGSDKIFINSSRGEVVNESALLEAMDRGVVRQAVIDVWNNEPNINSVLCDRATISTPHIAGYSEQGKAKGTAMMVAAFAHYYGIDELKNFYPQEIEKVEHNRGFSYEYIEGQMPKYYNVMDESNILKSNIGCFEEIRNNYIYRKEFF